MPLKFQPYMRKNVPQSILNTYILIMVHELLEKNTYDFVMKANIKNIRMYFVFHLFIFMFNDFSAQGSH